MRVRSVCPLLFLIIGGAVVVLAWTVGDDVFYGCQESRMRLYIREQLHAVCSGRQHEIVLSNQRNQIASDEFLFARESLWNAPPFSLTLLYGHNANAFLRSIEGIASIDELIIDHGDVSAPGLAYVATFPKLKRLVLYKINIDPSMVLALEQCRTLEKLSLAPREGSTISVKDAISVPTVRHLTLYDVDASRWVEQGAADFVRASELQSLTLVDTGLSARRLRDIQRWLPGCEIVLRD